MKPARVIVDRDTKPDKVSDRGVVDTGPMRKPHGRCPVCDRYRQLTATGVLKLHKPHGVLCDGSLQPPRAPVVRPTDAWARARKATISRDDGRCRKCGYSETLEVHHIKERVNGGTDDLENLITLCSDCHCEWTFCEPPVGFQTWLTIPPAAMLVVAVASMWPADVSAADFRIQLLQTCARVLDQRNKKKADP